MKIGGRAHTLADVREIGRAGFPFAEVSLRDPGELRSGGLDQLRRIAEEYNLEYLAHGPEEGDAWDPAELRRTYVPQIKALLACARQLNARVFTLHFWLDRRFISEPVIAEKCVLLQELDEFAAGINVQLCIENLSEHPEDFAPAFDKCPALGLTLDIGHGQLLTKRNTVFAFTESCPQRIRHVHAHDNRGGTTPKDDLHLPIGAGSIDFEALLPCLKSRGYDGTITLEVKPGDLAAGSTICERIWKKVVF